MRPRATVGCVAGGTLASVAVGHFFSPSFALVLIAVLVQANIGLPAVPAGLCVVPDVPAQLCAIPDMPS